MTAFTVTARVKCKKNNCGKCAYLTWTGNYQQDFCGLFGKFLNLQRRTSLDPLRCDECLTAEKDTTNA